jgi:hypothetical protein
MTHYAVWIGGDDDIVEIPEWETMTAEEKQRFDENASQAVGEMFLGIYEAKSPSEAMALAEKESEDWDFVPGA